MKLSPLLLGYTKKRVIDSIALLPLDNKRKGVKKSIESWIEEFRELDTETLDFIINLIYNEQAEIINIACDNCIDYIRITGLGSLRLNKSRHEILKTILHEGSISEEQVQSIILTNAELRKGLKEDVTLDIKIYEKD